MKTSLKSVITHQPVHRQKGKKGGRGKRVPVGMAKDFNFQIPVICVMFILTVWVAGMDDSNSKLRAVGFAILVLRIRTEMFQWEYFVLQSN